MSAIHKHTTTGKHTGDNSANPLQDDSAWSGEPDVEIVRPGNWIRLFLLMGSVFLVVFAALQWADVVEWVDGAWRLKPKREVERDEQIKNINDAEQYALIANVPGYYDCLHCPSKRMFLHTNEIWKYGVTNQGEKQRYTAQFLAKQQLAFLVQFRGTYSQCLVEEKRKLFDYPLLPENLARPDPQKLVLPPGNLQLR